MAVSEWMVFIVFCSLYSIIIFQGNGEMCVHFFSLEGQEK